MKKILAVLLSLVMAFTFMMPAFATDDAAAEESSVTDSIGSVIDNAEDIRDSLENKDVEGAVTGLFTFAESLFNAIHDLIHSLSEMFDFDCPFCDEKAEPEAPEAPEVPEEPEETVNTITNKCELSGAVLAGGDYVVVEDIEAESFLVEQDVKVNMDLQDNKISGSSILNAGELALGNGTVEVDGCGIDNIGNAVLSDVDMNAGNNGNYAAISRIGSYTEYNNVNIVSAGGGLGVVGGKTVFNSGSVAVNSTSTSGRYVIYVAGVGAELEINGGNFSFSKEYNQKRAYIYAEPGTVVIVNGGNFGPASSREGYTAGILGDGAVIIKGGTFGFDPSTWVAAGYEAVKDGSVWTVDAKA